MLTIILIWCVLENTSEYTDTTRLEIFGRKLYFLFIIFCTVDLLITHFSFKIKNKTNLILKISQTGIFNYIYWYID